MKPRALLLDLDDTLGDRAAAFRAWLATLVPPDALDALVALDAGGYGPKPALFAAIAARSGRRVGELRRSFVHDLPRGFHLRPDAARLLARFDGLTALITNGTSEGQRGKAAAVGLLERLDVVIVSEEVGAEKPDPAIFRVALERLGVAPHDALMIGDHPVNDVAGARAAGIPAVLLRTPRFGGVSAPDSVESLDELVWEEG